MEAARLSPPFSTARLYSFLNEFNEPQFKYEVWLCHEFMEMDMKDVYNTPVSDRREFIKIHNKISKKRKEGMGGK